MPGQPSHEAGHTAQPQAQGSRPPTTAQCGDDFNGWGSAHGAPAEDQRQTRLKTNVPLVPPKPKLFFTAKSIFISRAVLAQ